MLLRLLLIAAVAVSLFVPQVSLARDDVKQPTAVGASIVAPVTLLLVGAFTGEFNFFLFVAACVVIELLLIFGIARPAMKPHEAAGWALLWGFTAAVLGAAFWELVFSIVL